MNKGTRQKITLSQRATANIYGYMFIFPWLFGFLVLTIGPMVYSFFLSFTSRDFFGNGAFVEFENYRRMAADNLFWTSIKVTFKYVFIREPLKLIVALGIALALNSVKRASSFYRTLFYLPSVIGGSVAVAVMWRIILAKDGFLNGILSLFGANRNIAYLTNPKTAFSALVATSLLGFGSSMLIFLAGLKNIPAELYEAATIDGASTVRRFTRITVPMLSPVIFFNVIMGVINGFQTFTSAFVMTQGGPLNLTYFYVLNLYNNAFKYNKAGYASALAWVLFVIILFFSLIVFKSSDMWVFYETTVSGKKSGKKAARK